MNRIVAILRKQRRDHVQGFFVAGRQSDVEDLMILMGHTTDDYFLTMEEELEKQTEFPHNYMLNGKFVFGPDVTVRFPVGRPRVFTLK